MALSAGEIAFARDLFADLPDVTTRRMMGGVCLYCRGRIFAIFDAEGDVYLKAKGAFADRLAGEGSRIFAYTRDGRTRSMGYWTLPEPALDDPALAAKWAREALEQPE